jgi:DNA-binding MarR family transcriptional regulator
MEQPFKNPFELSDEERHAAGSAEDAVRSFRLLVFTGQRLRYLFDQRLREEGYTSQQGFLLTIVREHGRPTLGEVAGVMSTTHQNAKQIALALERKGMLRITRDGTDGRVRRLEPTAAGASGWKSRNDEDFAAIGAWFSALSGSDQKTLADLLAKLAISIV